MTQPSRPRRRHLVVASLGVVGIAGMALVTGCATRVADLILTRTRNDRLPPLGVDIDEVASCVVAAQTPEGPYYGDEPIVRRDLREGKPGMDLRLLLRIVDAATCRPLPNVAVDLWGCDAEGYYSGYADAEPDEIPFLAVVRGKVAPRTPGRAMRGRQVTGTDGRVEFLTLYPGWYKPRTVHLHLKLTLDARTIAVTHLYFPQAVTDAIHATAPYNRRGPSPYHNANDGMINKYGGGAGFPAIARMPGHYQAALAIAVDLSRRG